MTTDTDMTKIYGHLVLWLATASMLSACTTTGAERTSADADSVYLDKSLVPPTPDGLERVGYVRLLPYRRKRALRSQLHGREPG